MHRHLRFQKVGRRAKVGAAVILALLLVACAHPGIAKQPAAVTPKGPPVATHSEVETVVQPGPPSARQQRTTTVACPAGSTTLSGGAEAYLADGKAPNPSLRLVATLPLASPSALRWNSIVGTGGVDQSDSRVSAVAVCGSGVSDGRPTVVVTNAPGPTAAASDALATATCPAGTVLVGGGAAVSLTNGQPGPPQYFFTGSFPSSRNGAPAGTGPVPNSWTAIGALGGMPMTNGRIQAVAVCAPGASASVNVVVNTSSGPTTPESAHEVTATCPGHSVLVGGGVYTGPAELERPLQGLHLRGNFPSAPTGLALTNGGSANSWSVIANSGGVIALGARTSAFALCSAD